MFGPMLLLLDGRKDILFGVSVTILYITYYLMEVVKRPKLHCGDTRLRKLLEALPCVQALFWPTPWLLEARLQSVLGPVLRGRLLAPLPLRRQQLRLADGGVLALDWLDEPLEDARATLLLLPGLTGGAHADYARALAAAARQLRVRLVVFHNRGLGGMPLTSPRLYSALSADDVAAAVQAVGAAYPGQPLLGVGVSLGGLLLGHYLARAGPSAQVAAALLISAPLDVPLGSAAIEGSLANAPLSRHMARCLRGTLAAHEAALASAAWDRPGVEAARSLRQFDAAFTAGHCGFADVDAYYRAASLADKLSAFRVPTLCLCAADDPFQPEHVLPTAAAAASEHVALLVPSRGGHIGFVERCLPRASDGLMQRVTHQFFDALLQQPDMLHQAQPS